MKNKKNRNSLVPIASMFLMIGLTFDQMKWLKYIFLIISVVLSLIALQQALKAKSDKQEF